MSNTALTDRILACTGASRVVRVDTIQELWSGYGQIERYSLETHEDAGGREASSVIVKRIQPPDSQQHPRGWNNQASVARKLESYQIEANWYTDYARNASKLCAMPELYAQFSQKNNICLILEDLDLHYPNRFTTLSFEQCIACVHWLAKFHAQYLHHPGNSLWPIGTYWHLDTRADEFAAMPASELKDAAASISQRLNHCTYKTLVHGDAKVANVCFPKTNGDVAFVDFQYVGKGCGMSDLAYFLGSCLSSEQCHRHASALLDVYFAELSRHIETSQASAVETEWRTLFPFAWADFHRFLAGWMPEHHKINGYTKAMTEQALNQSF